MIVLYDVLLAVGGVVALFGGWLAVQAVVRRYDADLGDDDDVLECHMCGLDGSCHCGLKSLRPDRLDGARTFGNGVEKQ